MTIWLNRTGIFLSFLAGFMLAPELIGLGRIRKWEAWIESRLADSKRRVEEIFQEFVTLGASGREFRLATLMAFAILVMMGLALRHEQYRLTGIFSRFFRFSDRGFEGWGLTAWGIIFAIAGCVLFARAAETRGQYRYGKLYMGLVLVLCGIAFIINPDFGLFVFLFIFIVPASVLFLFLAFVTVMFPFLRTTNRVIGRTLSLFEADDRLRGLIVAFGIVLFILGNVFQLVATF